MALPYLVAGYPAWALVSAHSETPAYFGRYSTALLGMIGLTSLLYVVGLLGAVRRSLVLQLVGQIFVFGWTIPVVASNPVRALSGVSWVLPVIRLLAATGIVCSGFAAHRAGRATLGKVCLATGVLCGATGVADLGLLVALVGKETAGQSRGGHAFREAYDLGQISSNDIVVVGDSFVWGAGVQLPETFGKVIEADLKHRGLNHRVLLLGEIGSSTTGYIDILRSIPPQHQADLVLIAYYHNDMIEREGGVQRYVNMAHSLGASSLLARLLVEMPIRRLTPDVDSYHRHLIGNYDKRDPSFARRWGTLRKRLTVLDAEARRRSRNPPVFTIIPLMVDFETYPLMEAERELRELAAQTGFKVVDIFPELKARFGNGYSHRVAPNDNHCDAEVHRVMGEVLASAMYPAQIP